jgi:hypothetical protein
MAIETKLKSCEAEAKRTFKRFQEVAEAYWKDQSLLKLDEYRKSLEEFAVANRKWLRSLSHRLKGPQ